MLVSELEGLHEAQRLINRTADGKVVDRDLAQVALVVDDEQTPGGRGRKCIYEEYKGFMDGNS